MASFAAVRRGLASKKSSQDLLAPVSPKMCAASAFGLMSSLNGTEVLTDDDKEEEKEDFLDQEHKDGEELKLAQGLTLGEMCYYGDVDNNGLRTGDGIQRYDSGEIYN
jgi:hypothetical protein